MNTLVLKRKISKSYHPHIKKILVPVDYSATSINAFSFAVALAHKLKATIHVLNVFQMPYVDSYVGSVSNELLLSHQQKAESDFNDFKTRYIIPLHHKLIIEHTLKMGFAADNIKEVAGEIDADLIIMGSQDEKGVGDKLFGSVTWNAIKRAEIPVLAIPAAVQLNTIKNILFIAEGDPFDYEMISYLLLIATQLKAVIYVVQFLQIGNNDGSLLDNIRQHFRAEIDNNKIHLHLSIDDNNANVIKKFAAENDIDMISMLSHHQGLFGAIFHKDNTRNIVLHSNIPILAFNTEQGKK